MRRPSLTHPAFIVALVLMGVGALGFGAAISRYRLHLTKLEIQPPGNRQLSKLPTETEHWKQIGADEAESEEVLEVLGTRNYVSRIYERKQEPGDTGKPFQIQLHAAYYTGMIDTVPHVPERCFVGGGLQQATSSRVMALPLDTSKWLPDTSVPENLRGESGTLYTARTQNYPFSDAPGSRFRLPRDVTPERKIPMRVSSFEASGETKLYAGYFFVANGGVVANANDVRTLAFDLTSDYAYYLKVQVTTSDASSPEDMIEQAASLLDGLLPELMRCVPDWVEVEQGEYPADNPRRGGVKND
ncbi:MAG: exosortase-associated EpsI family protein [Phycisphaerales bacterium]